ncbi:GGDEF domain-containing protein, partial [Kineococcus glutinatus]|uniref:GGDEF domain-containing protein n=1 Tax=Kineococcus glutinatus TaxID=1070872 RepID=UPI0031EC2DBE
VRFDLEVDMSMAITSFTDRTPLFAADVAAHPRTAAGLPATTASAAWQPVLLRGGEAVGVLGVVWAEHHRALPPHVLPMLQTLAGEAAHAIERADLLERLASAAERDPLTGLANRRRWDETSASEIARAGRTGLPLTFALLDLDHFKRYNDTHGHLGGDELLRDFAAAATGCLREVDTLARWGGEEFVLALPGCGAEDAVTVADRIRRAVPHGQSCTVGIAQWAPGETAAEVVARADAALYRGKAAGRDVTVVGDAAHGVPAPV